MLKWLRHRCIMALVSSNKRDNHISRLESSLHAPLAVLKWLRHLYIVALASPMPVPHGCWLLPTPVQYQVMCCYVSAITGNFPLQGSNRLRRIELVGLYLSLQYIPLSSTRTILNRAMPLNICGRKQATFRSASSFLTIGTLQMPSMWAG